MPVSRLREQITDWQQHCEFDSGTRLLRNIALTGSASRNGYRYSEKALREAVSLYDQKPVFLDHAERRQEPLRRSTRDLVGSIVNPRFEDGRIRGDVRVIDTESGRTFLGLVEGDATGVGMSHVVVAQRSVDGTVVERIQDVLSVDVVVHPATTHTFREGLEIDPDGKPEVEFAEEGETESAAGTLTESEGAGQRLSALLPQLIGLLEQLQSSPLRNEPVLSEAVDTARESRIERELADAMLPPAAVTGVFRKMLLQTESAETRHELIADRVSLLKEAGRTRSLSSGRLEAGHESRRSFVDAIRGAAR